MILEKNKILSIINKHERGVPVGVTSVCSANPYVIKASIRNAKENGQLVLIESTSNQVDQYGGYTGITPSMFRSFVLNIAEELKYPYENVILGGDHLGPNRWQSEDSESAMMKARDQITAYVSAGYTKIHLDASMKCMDDGDPAKPLSSVIAAERSAVLCKAAEETYEKTDKESDPPVYVIGTDVPVPGGAKEHHNEIKLTSSKDVEETIELTYQAFKKYNLLNAWERVIAVVVQPGVEFSDSTVFNYNHNKAKDLKKLIENQKNLVYEAHSTDYQRKDALREMVEDHFAILKVGPWLTFALREALFALSYIENELLGKYKATDTSNMIDVVEEIMVKDPRYWLKYYEGSSEEQRIKRKFSYSDRIRYYWTDSLITKSLNKLILNLRENKIPLALISQFLPEEYTAVTEARISEDPDELINHKISKILEIYNYATFGGAD